MVLSSHKEFLQETLIPIRLSGITKSNQPFILSLWYVYMDDKIYLATPKTAKVVKYLLNEPRCAFEIASDTPPYCGIRGQAEARILEFKGDEILKVLLSRYLGGLESPLAKKLMKRSVEEVAIELTPIKIYQWNFTDRMKDSIHSLSMKSCPEMEEN